MSEDSWDAFIESEALGACLYWHVILVSIYQDECVLLGQKVVHLVLGLEGASSPSRSLRSQEVAGCQSSSKMQHISKLVLLPTCGLLIIQGIQCKVFPFHLPLILIAHLTPLEAFYTLHENLREAQASTTASRDSIDASDLLAQWHVSVRHLRYKIWIRIMEHDMKVFHSTN
jgi:hypothetical protein